MAEARRKPLVAWGRRSIGKMLSVCRRLAKIGPSASKRALTFTLSQTSPGIGHGQMIVVPGPDCDERREPDRTCNVGLLFRLSPAHFLHGFTLQTRGSEPGLKRTAEGCTHSHCEMLGATGQRFLDHKSQERLGTLWFRPKHKWSTF